METKDYQRPRLLRRLRLGQPVFMVEGTWTGYRSSQQRNVHRHYITSQEDANKLSSAYSIRYTDGTSLILTVKKVKNKAELTPKNENYLKLINLCLKYDKWAVEDLPND